MQLSFGDEDPLLSPPLLLWTGESIGFAIVYVWYNGGVYVVVIGAGKKRRWDVGSVR